MENTCSNLPVEQLVGLNLFCIFAVLVIFFFQTGHISCSYGPLRMFIRQGAHILTAFFMQSGYALYHTNSARKLVNQKGDWDSHQKRR